MAAISLVGVFPSAREASSPSRGGSYYGTSSQAYGRPFFPIFRTTLPPFLIAVLYERLRGTQAPTKAALPVDRPVDVIAGAPVPVITELVPVPVVTTTNRTTVYMGT